MDDSRARAERRRQRAHEWPVRKFPLGAEPELDPLDRSTVDERIAVMWPLARAAWQVAGEAIPVYARRDAPGTIVRGRQLS